MIFDSNIKSLGDLMKKFPDEQTCIEYLEHIIWNGTPVSPYDKDAKVWKCKGNYYKCSKTRKRFNILTGSMFENTKLGLRDWFLAMWQINHRKGISSYELARDIDVTQKSAWHLLHRIRACFGIENQTKMEGVIEVDEAYIGGRNKNRHKNMRFTGVGGRSTLDKDAVFGMVQRGGKLAYFVIDDCEAVTLQPIIRQYVAEGSVIISDSHNGYAGLGRYFTHYAIKDATTGYTHDYNPEIHTNRIENSWKGLKCCIGGSGTYNHVSKKHLPLYLNESAYRYNLRELNSSDKFNWLLLNSNVRTKYKDLIYGKTDAKTNN